ncbi:MAG: peptidyl-prolyl cis-trans isomerase [Candidatus Omnitrophica bacterium]|nr:peptidyl-prolyl cis-trans isomerase [Candidatus Omnitrophota bacterium]
MQKFLNVIVLIFLIAILALVSIQLYQLKAAIKTSSIEDLSIQLEFANRLLTKGLKKQAAEAFQEYLDKATLTKEQQAQILYKLGNIYLENQQYEEALRCFYKAELLLPNAQFANEMGQKIVTALENIGLSSQAKYELEARTAVGAKPKEEKDIVARINKKFITRDQIEEALSFIPEWARKEYDDPQKRKEFIKDYVAQEIIFQKAIRLGLDTDWQLRKTFEHIKKQMIVERFLSDRIKEKMSNLSETDIKLYYQANKDRYSQPAQVKIRYLDFDNLDKKEEIAKKLKEKEPQAKEVTVYENEQQIPDIGQAQQVINSFFQHDKDWLSDAVKIKDKFYLFLIVDKKDRLQPTFEEIKPQVEADYRHMKQQEIIQEIFRQTVKEEDVEFF